MENRKDLKGIQDQVRQLKNHNDRTKEYLSALELLLVDENNGRTKDRELSSEFQELSNRINDISNQIEIISTKF